MFVKMKMTASPFTVTPETSVIDAMEMMATEGVRRLVVVEHRRVVGVVSKGDVKAAAPSKATTLSAGEVNYLLAKLKVGRVMVKHPPVISPDALLEEAAVMMRDHKVEMLPVVKNDALVGVITESDILDAFIDIMGFRDRGTRLTIDAADTPGVLSQLGAIIAEHDVNINHLAVYRGQGETSTVVIGLNSFNTAGVEAALASAGFKVIYRLVNR